MTDIQRLRDLLDFSQEQLANYLGTSTRTIQNWEAGKTIPKSRIASLEKLASKFPDEKFSTFSPSVSEEMNLSLLSRGGKKSSKSDQVMIPLVHIDSVGGMWTSNELDKSEQYIERLIPLPDARQGDVAILQSGDSMDPHIPAGSILHIRQVQEWQEYFGYGAVYVLWLKDNRRITKLVKKYDSDPKNYILCCSYNPDAADEELPRSFIRQVWKVVNVVINKGW